MSTSILNNVGLSDSDVVHRIIGNTFIADFGIVKAIPAKGIVTVEMSVAKNKESIIITDCVLATISSSSVSFTLEPNIDDKVLVIFPKNFSSKMFTKENNETLITECASGYSMLGGIAILINQFNDKEQKNIIDFLNGTLTAKLSYSEDDEENLFTFNLDEKGAVNLKSNDLEMSITEEGAFSYKSNNTEVSLSDSDEITVKNGKATITVDSSGNVKVETSGKYSFKNNSTNLKEVIDGVAKEIENLTTVGSPATQATSPASKATIAVWRNTKLNLLME